MKINWRFTNASKNSFAVLHAACESHGFSLEAVNAPTADITCYSLNSINAPALLPEIAGADCITIAGGPHATACFRDVGQVADYVIIGEGEYALPALISCLEHGQIPRIPGIATGESYIPPDRTVLLDAYPPFSHIKGYIEISRGCPFGCAYCQTPRIFGHCMRHRSIDCIARWSEKFRDIRFVSPNALAYGSDGRVPNLEKVERLLSRLSGNIYFGTFPSETRPEFIQGKALELITTYCANKRLHFGAQSGSDQVLRRLGRGHSVSDVVLAVELCRDHGLVPIVDFIVGFPFETDDDQRATGELIRWVADRGTVHVHRFIPLPGTPLAGTSPRPLLPETDQLLGNLSLRGKLTGSWSDPKTRFNSRKLGNDIA